MKSSRGNAPGNCVRCRNLGQQMTNCLNGCKSKYEPFAPDSRKHDGETYVYHPVFIAKLFEASGENSLATAEYVGKPEGVIRYSFLTANENNMSMFLSDRFGRQVGRRKLMLILALNAMFRPQGHAVEVEIYHQYWDDLQAILSQEWPPRAD